MPLSMVVGATPCCSSAVFHRALDEETKTIAAHSTDSTVLRVVLLVPREQGGIHRRRPSHNQSRKAERCSKKARVQRGLTRWCTWLDTGIGPRIGQCSTESPSGTPRHTVGPDSRVASFDWSDVKEEQEGGESRQYSSSSALLCAQLAQQPRVTSSLHTNHVPWRLHLGQRTSK